MLLAVRNNELSKLLEMTGGGGGGLLLLTNEGLLTCKDGDL